MRRTVTLQTISTSPPIFRVRELLPDAVLDALLHHAAPDFEPSKVGDPTLGGGTTKRKLDDRRYAMHAAVVWPATAMSAVPRLTSSGMLSHWPPRTQDVSLRMAARS